MSKREVEQPPLSAYPISRGDGGKYSAEVLDAYTIYKWDEHYWFAVVKLKTTYEGKSKVSIRGYRWQWKSPYTRRGEDPKPKRWMRECHLIFNKKSQWEEFKREVDKMMKDFE